MSKQLSFTIKFLQYYALTILFLFFAIFGVTMDFWRSMVVLVSIMVATYTFGKASVYSRAAANSAFQESIINAASKAKEEKL